VFSWSLLTHLSSLVAVIQWCVFLTCYMHAPYQQCVSIFSGDPAAAVVFLQAAEARAQQAALMPSGPRKLGTTAGSSINHKQLTPAQAAAMAAERRARDNVWCGAEHSDDELEREVGQQTASTSKGPAAGAPAPAANGAKKPSKAAAAAATPAAALPSSSGHVARTGAAQQQQQRHELPPAPSNGHKQQHDGSSFPAQHHQQLSQQQAALQQQWQQHLQQSNSQRQQRRQQPRKRPAPDTVDLTMTDSDDEDQQQTSAAGVESSSGATAAVAAAAAAPSGEQLFTSCPCCAAAVQGALDPAVMQRLHSRQGYRQWCARHRREQQGQQGDSLKAADPSGLYGSSWTCSICTLINPASILVCQACLTAKNVI